jgi:hypothetical protein
LQKYDRLHILRKLKRFITHPSQIETLHKPLQTEVTFMPVLHKDRKNYKYEWESAGPTSEHAHHVRVVRQLLAPLVITNWQSAASQKCQQNNRILTSLPWLSQNTTATLQFHSAQAFRS